MSAYTPMTVITKLEVSRSPMTINAEETEMWLCDRCASIVFGRARHDEWHQDLAALEEALRTHIRTTSAHGMRPIA